jgi:ubiquinone/menaquinone biosynthesis C-methylase UbiE
MDATGTEESNRAYYDAFSKRYEDERGDNRPGGYHDLLDTLESECVRRFGGEGDVLEVGCGTGLVLQRIAGFARSAKGVDLSPGMLERARERGLEVKEGSATELPFPDASFDVACSFKVLAHVPEIERALTEMARVVRPSGYILAEFYNPNSLRGLLKRYGPAGRIADNAKEDQVYTRYDSPSQARAMTPDGCRFVTGRGIRIVTPTASTMRLPVVRSAFRLAEHALCDSPLRAFGGFFIAIYQKL